MKRRRSRRVQMGFRRISGKERDSYFCSPRLKPHLVFFGLNIKSTTLDVFSEVTYDIQLFGERKMPYEFALRTYVRTVMNVST